MTKLRIVSWNCNIPWNAKDPDEYRERSIEKIRNHCPDADVLILQEISKPQKQSDEEWWEGLQSVKRLEGKNDKNVRGLSVILENSDFKLVFDRNQFQEKALFGLPIKIQDTVTGDDLNLLAIWNWPFVDGIKYETGKNEGDDKPNYYLSLKEIFNEYSCFLDETDKVLAIGDFNWTMKPGAKREHDFFDELQTNFGLNNCYKSNKAKPGSGSCTLYMHKDRNESHTVDYALTGKGVKVESYHIGKFDDFIAFSDHAPLIVDITL